MDLSTIYVRIRNPHYSKKDMADDLELMCHNCKIYNDKKSVYYKCANAIQSYSREVLSSIPDSLSGTTTAAAAKTTTTTGTIV